MKNSPFLEEDDFFQNNTLDEGGFLKSVSHKYIKRTGVKGNYKYWYKDSNGKLVQGKRPSDTEVHSHPGGYIKGVVYANRVRGKEIQSINHSQAIKINGGERFGGDYVIYNTVNDIAKGKDPDKAFFDACENENLYGDRKDIVAARNGIAEKIKKHFGIDVKYSEKKKGGDIKGKPSQSETSLANLFHHEVQRQKEKKDRRVSVKLYGIKVIGDFSIENEGKNEPDLIMMSLHEDPSVSLGYDKEKNIFFTTNEDGKEKKGSYLNMIKDYERQIGREVPLKVKEIFANTVVKSRNKK